MNGYTVQHTRDVTTDDDGDKKMFAFLKQFECIPIEGIGVCVGFLLAAPEFANETDFIQIYPTPEERIES